MSITAFHRTLEQELTALARGVSLECLVCGEFVLHRADGTIACQECGTELRAEAAGSAALHWTSQAG